jgi:CheY-like chemotaxis protein/anti-sigma regulatory factor (Ser/Thr protein kinase)
MGEDLDLRCFLSAMDAMDYLRSGGRADAVLLDRMMPEIDGLTFMNEFRALPQFSHVPVIMQTAAGFPTQIAEGIAAGAYYYLTKPFSREVMTAVLSRALADYSIYHSRESDSTTLRAAATNVRQVELSFRSLGDVRDIARFLASFYPDPDTVLFGIHELMVNAVEHGNLGITYAEKTALVRAGTWEQEVARRLELPENLEKRARVRVDRNPSAMVLTIADQGPGFDWSSYTAFNDARARDPHGRGIAMARLLSFDDITFVPPGNKVICTKLQ